MEAIGLASSIITFIDVAYKILYGAHEVYVSQDGATRSNDHTSVVISDLQRVAADLRAHQLISTDPDLVTLSNKCHDLSGELLQLLHKFLPKTPGKWQSFVAACRILRKQKEAASMVSSLDKYREQISERLIWLLFKQQSPIKKSLDDMLHHAITFHNSNARKMEDVQVRIARTLECLDDVADQVNRGMQELQETLIQTNRKLDHLQLSVDDPADSTSALSQTLDELVRQTQYLTSLMQAMPSQNQVLRRLFYRSLFRREDEVITPEGDSFKWIFDTISDQTRVAEPQLDVVSRNEPCVGSEEYLRGQTSRMFIEFLRHSGRTLFVQGKAGCGKSTFMKLVANHEITGSILKLWAQTKRLVTIKVFFWQSDDPLQQSIEGLLRSILFQVLSQCPELIDAIFPHRPTAEVDAVEFRLSELEGAFGRLLNLQAEDNYCFFCFFDGLDEHQGDNLSHQNLATQLITWASRPNVKILCSARPYTVFIEAFRDAGDVIEFHSLTRSDISNFAETKFKESLGKPKYQESQRNCLLVVEDITESAQGIFLWAVMVVRTLINQVLDQDGSEKALRRRLQECIRRDSLDSLFELILQRVEKAPYIQLRSNMVLYLAANNPFESPLNALVFSWLDKLEWFQASGDTGPEVDACEEDYSCDVIAPRIQRVTSLLHQLTQGLLEVVNTHDPAPYFRYRVDFYHRSVRDYLRQHWKTGVRKSPFSSPAEEVQAYCRLRSLEAIHRTPQRFIAADPLDELGDDADDSVTNNLRSLFEYTFIWLELCSRTNSLPPNASLQGFEKALLQSQDTFKPFLIGKLLINEKISWRYHSRNALEDTSFIHWAAYWAQGEFVRDELSTRASKGSWTTHSHPDLNLLLTSSMAADVRTTRYLLGNGHRADEPMKIFDLQPPLNQTWQNPEAVGEDLNSKTATWESLHNSMGHQSKGLDTFSTVWLVFLRDFVSNVKLHFWKRQVASSWPLHLDRGWLERLAKIIEAYLNAGADPYVYFLLFHHSPRNMYKASLYQLLDVFKPENLAAFDNLLKKPWWKEFLSGSVILPRSPVYKPVTMEFLLAEDWKILGVGLDSGQELLGSFKVRVF